MDGASVVSIGKSYTSQEEGQDPKDLIIMMEKALINLGGYQCPLEAAGSLWQNP